MAGHTQESTLNDIDPMRRYEIAEAVWNAGGYVRWNANIETAITVQGNTDNFDAIIAAANSVIHPAPVEVAEEPEPLPEVAVDPT